MAAKKPATKKTRTAVQATKDSAPERDAPTAKEAEGQTRKVSCAPCPALNVRKAPDSDSEVVGEIADGAVAVFGPDEGGWCRCEAEGGYVKAAFLA